MTFGAVIFYEYTLLFCCCCYHQVLKVRDVRPIWQTGTRKWNWWFYNDRLPRATPRRDLDWGEGRGPFQVVCFHATPKVRRNVKRRKYCGGPVPNDQWSPGPPPVPPPMRLLSAVGELGITSQIETCTNRNATITWPIYSRNVSVHKVNHITTRILCCVDISQRHQTQ